MKKYLIKLADHLDKKGLHKEADYIDCIIKSAFPEHDIFVNYDGGGSKKVKNKSEKDAPSLARKPHSSLDPRNHVGFCKSQIKKNWQSLTDDEFMYYAGCLLTGTYDVEKVDLLYHLDNIYDKDKVNKKLGIVFHTPDGRLTSEETKKIYYDLFNDPNTRPILKKLDKILDPNNKLK